jgi:nucleoside-diphosphate-sugar epimerase
MKKQTILVTGAAGFLGSHLCDVLLAEGNEVIGVDNLATGSAANLAHLKSEPLFRFEQQDIGVLRRSVGASAGRELLGQRESDWPALGL